MSVDRDDRYRDSESDASESEIEDSGLTDSEEYPARAALDDSGYWFYLLGEDVDGHGHYAKQRDDSAAVAVLDEDQRIVAYRDELDRGRLGSYVWEREWEVLTEYGAELWEE